MRDVLIFPVNSEEAIVVASDNSGGIGEKDKDSVKVPYETVAYYSFRVAVMECISAGAEPFAAALHNFCGEDAWNALVRGIKRGAEELDIGALEINGSTESNFTLLQSAVGLSVLGKMKGNGHSERLLYTNQTEISVIGSPLVGEEVVGRGTEAAPLKLFQEINSLADVETLPVGSKGIIEELNGLFLNKEFTNNDFSTDLDLHKSSGPSTCFIAVYPQGKTKEIRRLAGSYFHILSKV
ncbi:ATP-binding protein [Bacillus sp. ISL-47]|uniref:ATP-binding protein n=1 Tax=Bacillus sp. ISL-47 TaxID=2819130 RepID=UPI001BEB788E|nr:ATP-binding protein [Bacillus sp. ISL-47]MBT2689182.1 ATP-binding protein [Bacillus sp. ISL-47]MBT2710288.1 hypothetical protein [Pseudomonas sp. ISL-84]